MLKQVVSRGLLSEALARRSQRRSTDIAGLLGSLAHVQDQAFRPRLVKEEHIIAETVYDQPDMHTVFVPRYCSDDKARGESGEAQRAKFELSDFLVRAAYIGSTEEVDLPRALSHPTP